MTIQSVALPVVQRAVCCAHTLALWRRKLDAAYTTQQNHAQRHKATVNEHVCTSERMLSEHAFER